MSASMSASVPVKKCLAIVLAAGEGTRMKSTTPKVLHRIAGRSMLGWVLAAVAEARIDNVAVVIGPGRDDVAAEAMRHVATAQVFVQTERLGTAHAALHARAALAQGYDAVLVLFGDTPLVTAQTIASMRDAVLGDVNVAALGFQAADPTGYGRFIVKNGALIAIREHKDASDEERAITLCNGGLMALKGDRALAVLDAIGNANAQKEYYLTDAVEAACAQGLSAVALEADEQEILGINDRAQLAGAESIRQDKLRLAAMKSGVTLLDPATTYFTYDTKIAPDVVVEPCVFFGPGVIIERDAVIHSHSHLEGAHVGQGASVGPFARLRPGTVLGQKVKIGNFVETKSAAIDSGAKVSHLSYMGDVHVGAEANIGAGTITGNYDGFNKFRTEIGKGAFIGSNSVLVAPVAVGPGAYVASGSVITHAVPADALAVARGRQAVKDAWATQFRARPENQKKSG